VKKRLGIPPGGFKTCSMKKNAFNKDISAVIAEHDEVCLSVTLTLYTKSPERQKNNLRISKILKTVKEQLDMVAGPVKGLRLYKKAQDLLDTIDMVHPPEGIGLYVSSKIGKIFSFPFKVTARVFVEDRFEIRDLVYLQKYNEEYFIVAISGKDTRLYRCKGPEMEMIKDKHFPALFTDDYEYARPAPGNSTGYSSKSPERDKSILKDIRMRAHYNNVDKLLDKYIAEDSMIILAGPKKEMPLFIEASNHKDNIAAKVEGNFLRAQNKLADTCWRKVKEVRKKRERDLIRKLRELNGRLVYGLPQTWENIKDGNAFRLIVEKDYAVTAFMDSNHHLKMNADSTSERVSDAVDLLIKSILDKSGEVEFVDNGNLAEFEGVALVTRF
jgi:hypothetical protein